MIVKIYTTTPDGVEFSWTAAVYPKRDGPCLASIQPPKWRKYVSSTAALKAGRGTIEKLFPEAEIRGRD